MLWLDELGPPDEIDAGYDDKWFNLTIPRNGVERVRPWDAILFDTGADIGVEPLGSPYFEPDGTTVSIRSAMGRHDNDHGVAVRGKMAYRATSVDYLVAVFPAAAMLVSAQMGPERMVCTVPYEDHLVADLLFYREQSGLYYNLDGLTPRNLRSSFPLAQTPPANLCITLRDNIVRDAKDMGLG